MNGDDGELLEAFARERTEEAFLALYDRHAPAMYALAVRLMGSRREAAADVLQEAWMRALPRLAAFRRQSSLRTWLCGFVVNCCRERLRTPLADRFDDGSVALAGGEARAIGTRLDLEKALAALPDGYRAVIVLHDIEGYTHREIAAALGIDEGTSKSQLSRGRAALRRALSAPSPMRPV